jgi:hypothetical protein
VVSLGLVVDVVELLACGDWVSLESRLRDPSGRTFALVSWVSSVAWQRIYRFSVGLRVRIGKSVMSLGFVALSVKEACFQRVSLGGWLKGVTRVGFVGLLG